ncbi:MAG: hypothetical protein LBL26_02050 [Peptococcaceae bacterium]|jgi:hypothetical protein|nr:hypothetical protein [Peptococcaceae bacterium]
MTDQTKKKLAVAGGIIFCAVLALLTAWRMTPQPLETALPGAAETRLADGGTSTPRTPADEYPGAAPDMAAPSNPPASDPSASDAPVMMTPSNPRMTAATNAPGSSRSDAESASAESFAPTAGVSGNGKGEATNPSGIRPSAADTPDVTQATPGSKRPDSPEPEASGSAAPVVIPSTNPRTTAAANAPDMEGAEQSIQPEVTRPASAKPGETHERPDDPALLDPAAPPATPQPPAISSGGGLPGFENVPYSGPNHGVKLRDMYENGNKIGIMD